MLTLRFYHAADPRRPSQDLLEHLDDAFIQDTPSIGGCGSIQNIRFCTHYLSRLMLLALPLHTGFYAPCAAERTMSYRGALECL